MRQVADGVFKVEDDKFLKEEKPEIDPDKFLYTSESDLKIIKDFAEYFQAKKKAL